ncbi:serine--tRNA ligase [Blattabacterium cuenoti]|uniref:serine--tRNA ligase n=1 Tax=Blattabacterium cuenoti TaxID=1653831 RepID=UPI00163CF374|nr:serine--tRNA ligase [Blattabacterium cuenoti]
MIKPYFIRKNIEKVLNGLKKRNFKKIYLIDKVLKLDEEKKKYQHIFNKILEKENSLSKEIAILLKTKKIDQIEILKTQSFFLKKKKKEINFQLKETINILEKCLYQIPNLPDKLVPNEFGKCHIIYQYNPDIKNVCIDNPLPHWELSKKFPLFNLNIGSKICGSGFSVYIDKCAKLQRCLIQYFLDKNEENLYKEYSLPYLVNQSSAFSTGQIPDKENQMYFIEKDNFYLIPTGEVPLMNCYRDQIFSYLDLPIKATSYTSCFRRESGSYGLKVRGLNRLHQFDKVEIIQITTSNSSSISLKEMIEHIKNILKSLYLPFRIILLNGNELGYSSSITYDFEVYSFAQKKWLEVSSVSNCTNFQSHRLNIKYKNPKGNIEYCHTLNGSSLALPRILVTLLENNQSYYHINIPKVLIPYTGFDSIK